MMCEILIFWLFFSGSAVLFNIRKFGAKIFTEGGLKTLLEARHPIKVCNTIYNVCDVRNEDIDGYSSGDPKVRPQPPDVFDFSSLGIL